MVDSPGSAAVPKYKITCLDLLFLEVGCLDCMNHNNNLQTDVPHWPLFGYNSHCNMVPPFSVPCFRVEKRYQCRYNIFLYLQRCRLFASQNCQEKPPVRILAPFV